MSEQFEGQYRAELDRGGRARRLIEDDLLAEAFATVEQRIMGAWHGTAAADVRIRERLWVMLNLLKAVKGHLHEVVTTGKLAAISLAEIEEKRRRRKSAA